jgi:hypothetical protein
MIEPKAPAPAVPAPTAPAANLGFARPVDLGEQLVRSLAAGDFKAAAALAAAADPAQVSQAESVMSKIFKDMGYKVDSADKIDLLGQVENFTRLSIPLRKPGDTTPSLRIQLDLERDDKMGWKIGKLNLPKELSTALAELPVTPMPATAAAPTPAPASQERRPCHRCRRAAPLRNHSLQFPTPPTHSPLPMTLCARFCTMISRSRKSSLMNPRCPRKSWQAFASCLKRGSMR